MLAYRLRYYTGIVTYLLFVTVHYFIWQAIFYGRPVGTEIHGFTLREMVTYVTVGWISRSFYFSDIDYDMDEIVRTGQVSMYLLRPVNFQLMMIAQAIGGTLFRGIFFTAPVAVLPLILFDVLPPQGVGNFLLFCFSTLTAFLILAQLNFIIGLLAFSFKSITGVIHAKYYVIQLFSGLLLPLSFFPEWAQTILHALPFKTITYVPLQFYLGHVSPEQIPLVVFNQIFWIVALAALGHYLWYRAFSELTLQGG